MNKRIVLRSILTGIVAVAIPMALTGCGKSAAHYKKVEKDAVRYYKEKYGDTVTVEKSIVAGNSGLFGYLGVKDRAYELSDGAMVYWNENGQYYADNRQAGEIDAAIREEIMKPAIAELGAEAVVSEYSINRTGMESFDECVYREFYDGSIRDYAKKEQIRISDLSVAITAQDFKEKTERFCKALESYSMEGGGEIGVAGEGWQEPLSLEICQTARGNPNAAAYGMVNFGEGVRWIENVFVEAAPGVVVSSGMYDFVLEPGDVVLEEAGTGQDLQQKLDEAYYSLPVEAEENKKGGYTARDQAHESRAMLGDLESPIYQIRFSERVQEKRDSNGKVTLYIMTDLPQEGYLWYYTNTERYAYTLFRLAEPGKERGDSAYLAGVELVYAGTVEWEKLE